MQSFTIKRFAPVIISVSVIGMAVLAGVLHNIFMQPVTVDIPDARLIENYSHKYPPTKNTTPTGVRKKLVYVDQWIIADIAFDTSKQASDEPEDGGDYIEHLYSGIICVFEVEGENVKPPTCSNEGFYEGDFPDTAPRSIIERANQPL